MKYLEMEHERLEMMQSIKEAREKRVFTMLQLFNFSGSYCDRCIFAER